MLKFRRAAPKTPPEEAPGQDAPDKAQVLLAMLGEDAAALGVDGAGKGGADISEDRLRVLARELIAQVEGKAPRGGANATPDHGPAPEEVASKPPRRTLFASGSPLKAPTAAPSFADHVAEAAQAPAPPSAPTARVEPIPTPEVRAPQPAAPPVAFAPQTPRRARKSSPLLPPAEVTRLIAEGLDPSAPWAEHPGVIAITLAQKPPLEQAAALRGLPRAQARSVHRALRTVQANAAMTAPNAAATG